VKTRRPTPQDGRKPPIKLPRREVLALIFGKLVAVDAVKQLSRWRRKRQHWNLHHVVPLGIVVDPTQRFWMDEILGIVRDDDFEPRLMFRFEKHHSLEDPVQVVRFGRGAVVWALST